MVSAQEEAHRSTRQQILRGGGPLYWDGPPPRGAPPEGQEPKEADETDGREKPGSCIPCVPHPRVAPFHVLLPGLGLEHCKLHFPDPLARWLLFRFC